VADFLWHAAALGQARGDQAQCRSCRTSFWLVQIQEGNKWVPLYIWAVYPPYQGSPFGGPQIIFSWVWTYPTDARQVWCVSPCRRAPKPFAAARPVRGIFSITTTRVFHYVRNVCTVYVLVSVSVIDGPHLLLIVHKSCLLGSLFVELLGCGQI